jgi:hypothetical protein
MVLEGHNRKEAAQAAGMADKSLANAFRQPHVKAAYNQLLEVLRTSTRARNFHRLDAIADRSSNDMARVQAIKTMEAITDAAPPAALQVTRPGLVIVITNPPPKQQIDTPMIDVTPSRDHQSRDRET